MKQKDFLMVKSLKNKKTFKIIYFHYLYIFSQKNKYFLKKNKERKKETHSFLYSFKKFRCILISL